MTLVESPSDQGRGEMRERVLRRLMQLAAYTCDARLAMVATAKGELLWQEARDARDPQCGGLLASLTQIADELAAQYGLCGLSLPVARDTGNANVPTRAHLWGSAPIQSVDGQTVAVLGVIGARPRTLPAAAREELEQIATLVCSHLGKPAPAKTSMSTKSGELACSLLRSTTAAIYSTDERGAICYVNPAYRRVFGLRPDHAPDEWAHGVHPDDRERMEREWADFCLNPRPSEFSYRTRLSTGEERAFTEAVVKTQGGAGYVGAITEVTPLVASQQALADAEVKLRREHAVLRAVLDTIPVQVFWKSADRRYLGCNRAFAAGTRFASEPDPTQAVTGKTVFELGLPEATAQESEASYERVFGTREAELFSPLAQRDPSGRLLHLLSSRIPLQNADGSVHTVVGIISDITPIIQAHQEVARLNQRWDLAFSGSGDGVWDWTLAPEELYLSPRWKEMLGYAESECRSSMEAWMTLVHPADRGATDAALQRLLDGQAETCATEQRLRHRDDSYRWILVRGRIADRDAEGRATRIVGTTSDITAIKCTEAESANARKLEAIGQLAAGVAHEINTPAQFVGDNLQFTQESVAQLLGAVHEIVRAGHSGDSSTAPLAELLARIDYDYVALECPKAIAQAIEGIERISKIVRALKELSHPGLEVVPTDLNRAIESTVTVAGSEWKYVAEMILDLAPDLPEVPVTPSDFQQMVLNLIVNAAHAIEEARRGTSQKGQIRISTRHSETLAEVLIADDGCGIPEEHRANIFNAFFTTKPLGKGTGQGLALVNNVIRKHHGTIRFESTIGQGTTFIFCLPLTAADSEQPGERP